MLQEIIKTGKLRVWAKQRELLRQTHKLNYLFWECTLKCNLHCQHCGSNAQNINYQGELSTKEVKTALKDIADNFKAQEIMLAITGGEPLLRQDLFEVTDFANKLGFPWGMVTNGYLVNEKIVQKMKETGMKTVVVSIDGLGKTHDSFRGLKGSYEKAINAVKLLADKNFLFDLQITSSIHQRNIAQLEEMYQTFLPLGISSWRIMEVDPIGRAENNHQILLRTNQKRQLFDFIKEKRKKSNKVRITYGCSGFLGLSYEGELRDNFFYCTTGINTGSILYNGDIFVCPNVPRQKKLIQGNVKKDNFSDIWSNKFECFRQKERTSCSKCKKCDFWEECLGNSYHLWDFKLDQPKVCFLAEF